MVKLENTNVMQVYSAVDFEDEIDYSNKILDMVGKLKSSYSGEKVESIRMLPEVLTISKLEEFANEKEYINKIPVGLDAEDIRTQFVELNGGIHLIIGGPQTGKTNILKVLLTLKKDIETYVIDSKSGELYSYNNKVNQYITTTDEEKAFLERMQEVVKYRKDEFEKHRINEPGSIPKIYYASLSPIVVLVDDSDNFISEVNSIKELSANKIIDDAINVGITFIIVAQSNGLKGYDELTKIFKGSINAIILGNPNEQNIINAYTRSPEYAIDLGYIYNKGKMKLIKIPKVKDKTNKIE